MKKPIKGITPNDDVIQGDQQGGCLSNVQRMNYNTKNAAELALIYTSTKEAETRDAIQNHVDVCDPEFQRDFLEMANNPKLIPRGTGKISTWSVDELLAMDFPEPIWLVPDLIPIGLVSLAGKPKVGKSFMALQLAIAMASGGFFLGKQVDQSNVLYLALEDSPRRLKNRLVSMKAPGGIPLTFKTSYKLMNEGGINDLYVDITANEFKLVILDTFGRSTGKLEVRDYSENVLLLGQLQSMAQEAGITMLLVDHHSKMAGENPILDLIGSIGKSATFDSIMALYKNQGKSGAKLMIVGRDQEDCDLAVEFDPVTFCWQSMGDLKSHFQQEILDAIKALQRTGDLATNANISQHLDADRGNVSKQIAFLISTGKVKKLPKIGVEQPFEVIND